MKIGLFGLLFVILLTLKLAGVAGMATVSWWIVFLPLIIPLAIWAVVVGVFAALWHVVTKR